jgi:hypothetical protein
MIAMEINNQLIQHPAASAKSAEEITFIIFNAKEILCPQYSF